MISLCVRLFRCLTPGRSEQAVSLNGDDRPTTSGTTIIQKEGSMPQQSLSFEQRSDIMVRVISVHHFDSQIIQTCEEALAVCTAPEDRILIALAHHVIEVRDIADKDHEGGNSAFSFPTVDRVSRLLYCATGNYVATLEKKDTRQNKEVTYARVYTNWDRRPRPEMETAMRARIAGRVTPSSSQTGGDVLEMIELPVRFPTTTAMTCCQETGNILLACDRILCLFQLVTRTHDISRLKFLDFELWPVTLELSFSPRDLTMSEDVVGAASRSCLHVFRINKGFARPTDWSSSSPRKDKIQSSKVNKLPENKKEMNEKEDDDLERPSSPVRLKELMAEVSEGRGSHELNKLGNGAIPVLAVMPSIECRMSHHPARNLRASPFKPPGSVTMGVAIREMPVNEPWAEQMTTMVESLLQLELGNWDEVSPTEEFRCLVLRPLYKIRSHQSYKSDSSCPKLRSQGYGNLVAFDCFICTKQQGYMYHLTVHDSELSLAKCISEYNFTSSVSHVVMEPYLLHVITCAGLESYTLRSVHAIEETNDSTVSPKVEEPVCLVGLRPFMNVEHLLLSKSHILVMSSTGDYVKDNESPEMTIYCLRLPSPGTLYTDILSLGASYKFTNSSCYLQLLSEAHSVLRMVVTASSDQSCSPNPSDFDLYAESCALLMETYLSSDNSSDWPIGYKYSTLAHLNPMQVMERLKKLQLDAKSAGVDLDYNQGLLHYFKLCLIACEDDSKFPMGALNFLLDLLESTGSVSHERPYLLSSLVLESPVLRQFMTERSIRVISKRVNDSNQFDEFDCLALTLLYLAKNRVEEAGQALTFCRCSRKLIEALQQNWTLLFENTKKKVKVSRDEWEGVTLSELAVLLLENKPRELSQVLRSLVTDTEDLELQHVMLVFVNYFPASVGREGARVAWVLQQFLEDLFTELLEKDSNWRPDTADTSMNDALEIFMRSLLGNLVNPDKQPNPSSDQGYECDVFAKARKPFLDLLPPFLNSESLKTSNPNLFKLQCLLCNDWLSETALSDLAQFATEFFDEDTRFSLVVLAQPKTAVEMILNKYPRVLPDYARDCFKSEADWKYVISVLQSRVDESGSPTVEAAETKENDDFQLYSSLLNEILTHLAKTMKCEAFTRVLPPGKEFEGYLLKCQQTAHAAHLKDVIMVTGYKLLATLNSKSFT